jgi:uncharacterized protein
MVADRLMRISVAIEGFFVWLVRLSIRAYQLSFRLLLGPRCRFFPTCSEYASEAFARHGLFEGGRLTTMRLCRCRPGGGSGLDLVPEPASTVMYKEKNF